MVDIDLGLYTSEPESRLNDVFPSLNLHCTLIIPDVEMSIPS